MTVTLSGPGTATLEFLTAGGSADPISFTTVNTTTASRITVSNTKGVVMLPSIQITGSLAAFTATKSDLVGNFTCTGTLGSLTLKDVNVAPSTIEIDGTAVQTTYKFGILQDVAILSGGGVKSLTALQWTNTGVDDDSLTTTLTGTLNIKGNVDADLTLTSAATSLHTFTSGTITGGTWTIAGAVTTITTGSIGSTWNAAIASALGTLPVKTNASGTLTAKSAKTISIKGNLSNATLSLTGGLELGKVPALGSLVVTGSLTNSRVRSVGNIGVVTLGGATGSDIFAGVSNSASGLPTAGDFTTNSTLTTFTLTGKAPFANSFVAASSIGAVTLADVTTGNGGIPFGIATQMLKSFTLKRTGQTTFLWTPKQSSAILNTLPGDLKAQLL